MSNHATAVGYLCNIARSVAAVKPSVMPHLIVEHDDASSFSQIVVNLAFPLCSFNFRGWPLTEQMRAGNYLCATIFDLGDIRQIVVGGEKHNC